MANANARALRKRMSPQEVKLWVQLRSLRAEGFHFRRQAPRDGFILDFVCLREKLIVELDGDTHGQPHQSARDSKRDRHFANKRFRTLRFWNTDVDQNLDGVVETVYRILTSTDPTPALRADPPLKGEGGLVE
jgi:very-short-patch-repair endonuclease